MHRFALICSVLLFAAPIAFSQGDEEILETVRALVAETFDEQIATDLSESTQMNGLAPSDKERLIQQLSDDYVACFENAAVEYSIRQDIPLSDLVSSDGSITFKGDSGTDFEQLLVPCLQAARQAAGLIN